jgi:hypothetical protein
MRTTRLLLLATAGAFVLAPVALPAASYATTTATATPIHRPDAGENGGPGDCTPARDGQVWTSPSGYRYVCRYYYGEWTWVLEGCLSGAAVTNAAAPPAAAGRRV